MRKFIIVCIILFVAGLSFWAGGRYGNWPSAGSGASDKREVLYYTDPMTPGFRSDKPGVAPCGMPLEPVYANEEQAEGGTAVNGQDLPPGAVKISPDRQQLIGVKTSVLEPGPMTYTLRLYGQVVPDETMIYRVNSSTDCWIRELSDVTTGSIVEKHQILAEALSPAYYNAQVTYLIALGNIDRIRQQLGGQLRHQQADLANNQVRVAVQALQNLGVTDAQTEELANTRRARPFLQVRAPSQGLVLSRKLTLNQWFKASDEFYTIADISRVWVYADVYENEARHLGPGMAIEVRHDQLGKTFQAKVGEVLPLFDPIAKTLKVQLVVDNPRYELRPDMFVDVEIPITMPACLNVPADAVIDSGARAIVYVDMGNGFFEPRRVETGWRLGRRIEITGGLAAGEKIIVSGNFLIDSESRMKTALATAEIKMNPPAPQEVRNEQTIDPEKDGSGKPGVRDWADLLAPIKKAKGKKVGQKPPGNTTRDIHGKSTSTSGIIDWDGEEPPGDWKGWGAFPGAEYLGLKNKTQDKPLQPSNQTETGVEKAFKSEEKSIEDAPVLRGLDPLPAPDEQ